MSLSAPLVLFLLAVALLSSIALVGGLLWQSLQPRRVEADPRPALPEPPQVEADPSGVARAGRMLTAPPVAQPGGLVVDSVRAHLHWMEGRDLKAYPERLGELIEQLLLGHRAAQLQLQRLAEREAELSAKPGREALARRYRQDQDALQQRAAAMRRVMGSVWRTRAILLLRVQLAVASRRRPALTGLPSPTEVSPDGLDAAATSYAAAAQEVRVFLRELDEGREELAEVVESPPPSAELSPEDRRAVNAERAEVAEKLASIRERMDALADTLTYLADRMRTQAVVAGAGLQMDVEPEAGRLLDEVAAALKRLDGLSELGDKALADAAMTELSRDITELEREGMEADAEAKAGLEVERLLRQFEVG